MTRQLVFRPQAENDLDGIFDFIAADNPRRAMTYIEDIRDACRGLCDAPMTGMERSDIRDALRILALWRGIVLAYELPPGKVRVPRVFSGGQDYQAIMGGETRGRTRNASHRSDQA